MCTCVAGAAEHAKKLWQFIFVSTEYKQSMYTQYFQIYSLKNQSTFIIKIQNTTDAKQN